MKKIILIAAVMFVIGFAVNYARADFLADAENLQNTVKQVKAADFMFTSRSSSDKDFGISEVIDKETGCHYILIIWNTRITMTPRMDKEGKPMCK